MSEVPRSGILTFLFTDLEGSTPRWEQYPDLMQAVSARHDELLRAVFEGTGGRVVKTTGDGFHVVFTSPADGIAAALTGQQAIAAENWPAEVGGIKVRMGLHAGEGQAREGDYYGPELNRAARVMGIGHGGQVLVSGAATALLRGRLPEGAELIDLGLHRLKGLSDLEQVYQLVHPSLETVFPPLQSSASIPHNLPTQLTTFIGRRRELEEVKQRIEKTRLLTLLGPGGTGKTRLMLQAAGDLVKHFPDGVWLVELASLTDPEHVPEAAAAVLGVRGHPDRSLVDSLAVFLRRKEILLLLDNAEHLIQSTADLAEQLLMRCPLLKILVSSREPLSIGGEVTFQVPSLSLPAENGITEAELEASEAVQLFLERARTVRSDFELTTGSVPAVAEIVRQLDGIPLALELAAARLRVMSAEQIAARLNDRFRLLVGGRRTASPRQQTLLALIEWSWNLLEKSEQALLRRLSVFSGGWILEDAQQVAQGSQLDEFAIIDNLESLVDKSLVVAGSHSDGGDRFNLLETIRQYAWERLTEAREDEAFGDRHAARFVGLIQEAGAAQTQKETVLWIKRLAQETDNFRAVFNWLESHDPMLFLEAAGKLMLLGGQGYWSFPPTQALRWLERAIEICRTADIPEEERQERQMELGIALSALSSVHFALGRNQEGAAAGAEAVSILRSLGDSQPLAYALGIYAFNLVFLGRLDEAHEAGEEAGKISRGLGDVVSLSRALGVLGLASMMGGDINKAQAYLEEAMGFIEELGGSVLGIQILAGQGQLLARSGDLEGAEAMYREVDRRFHEMGAPMQTILTRNELAHLLRQQGKWAQALPLYRESILYFQDMGHEPAVAHQLECIAYIAIAKEAPDTAARLLGAAQAIRERTNNPIKPPWQKAENDQAMKELAEILGRAHRDAIVGEGRSMTLDEAVVFARTVSEV